MTAERPPVPHAPDPGDMWVVEEEEDASWQPADEGRKCRAYAGAGVAHGAPAVVKQLRGLTRRVWWQLCLEHGEGHWTEKGRVMHWVLQPNPDWKPPET
jgi:hypothetical protein